MTAKQEAAEAYATLLRLTLRKKDSIDESVVREVLTAIGIDYDKAKAEEESKTQEQKDRELADLVREIKQDMRPKAKPTTMKEIRRNRKN